jgi:hypothetical protein
MLHMHTHTHITPCKMVIAQTNWQNFPHHDMMFRNWTFPRAHYSKCTLLGLQIFFRFNPCTLARMLAFNPMPKSAR